MARPSATGSDSTFSPCVVVGSQSKLSRRLRIALWSSAGVLLTVAVLAVAFQRPAILEQNETDEIMKPWEDGIYPARAHFPPGYKFGDDNTFGEGDTFAAGDKFGSGNTFGKSVSFGPGDYIGDSNSFGKGATFGAGVEVGNKNLISDDATFAAGDVVGNDNQFGKGVRFGKRVSIGHDNFFGTYNEFGRRDQFGARNIFGKGTIFGGDANFGKEQQFGSDITWDTTRDNENLQGGDLFGYRDWGLDVDALPENDKEGWLTMSAKDPDYVPEREVQVKVMSLKDQKASPAAAAAATADPKAAVHALAAKRVGGAAADKGSDGLLQAVEQANKQATAIGQRLKLLTAEMEAVQKRKAAAAQAK